MGHAPPKDRGYPTVAPGRGQQRKLTRLLPEADQIRMAEKEYIAGRIEIDEFERRVETALTPPVIVG